MMSLKHSIINKFYFFQKETRKADNGEGTGTIKLDVVLYVLNNLNLHFYFTLTIMLT